MEKLIVSTSPHIHTKTTTQTIMRDMLIALTPAWIAAVVLFVIDVIVRKFKWKDIQGLFAKKRKEGAAK